LASTFQAFQKCHGIRSAQFSGEAADVWMIGEKKIFQILETDSRIRLPALYDRFALAERVDL